MNIESCLLSMPYGDYKDARMIIVKIAYEQGIKTRDIAATLNLKRSDSAFNLIHNFKMKIYNFSESILNDRYKRCKNRMLINL